MICERIADSLPEAVDGTDGLGPAERAHVETCLRCQAELVQYRKLLRAMHTLRTDVVEPAPGVLAELLASVATATSTCAPRTTRSSMPGVGTTSGYRSTR